MFIKFRKTIFIRSKRQYSLKKFQTILISARSQEESTKQVVRKLDDERKLSFKKVGNEKQFCFNQSLEQHLDAAQHELSKIDTSSMNEEVKKTIEAAKEELKEGQQEVSAHQKHIHLADRSEYGWATVEAYDDDELAEDPADEKKMADAEREAARKVTKKRKAKGKGNYRGGDFKKRPFGDQVPAANPGPSKIPDLRPRPLGPCWGCSGFGHIVANCPQPPKWYPCESDDVYVCDDLYVCDMYVCDAVHVPDVVTSSNVGSAIDNQGADNKEDLVTKGSTDLIAGPSHLQLDCLRECFTQSEIDCEHQQMGGTPSNEIISLDTSEEVLPHNLEDTNCRSWEVEYDTNIQTTKVKGRLKNNVAYWQDILQAPAPVLDWIQNGYKLPLFSELPRSVKHNQQSALANKQFVDQAVTELLNNGCVCRVSTIPHVCSPLSVVTNL